MRNEMESSKEKIEAQLCAYVEGELDDAQRAEIEQHLAANPHHQALIAELRAASGLLRDLPRVKAPIELNESLCGQLERSALLDPTDDPFDPARSVNRWPQFTAVAAVLLLAASLAFVVIYVLPPSGGNGHNQVALDEKGLKKSAPVIDAPVADQGREPAKDAREKRAELPETLDRSKTLSAAASSSEGLVPKTVTTAPTQFGVAALGVPLHNAPDDLNVARMPAAQGRGLVTAAEVENVRKWMNASLGADNTFFKQGGNSLYLVVSTANTAAANGQLAAYFKTNGIQYMEDDTRVLALADARDAKSEAAVRSLSTKTDTLAQLNKGAEDKTTAGGVGAGGFGARGGASATPLQRSFKARRDVSETQKPAAAVGATEAGEKSATLGRGAAEEGHEPVVGQRTANSEATPASPPAAVAGKPAASGVTESAGTKAGVETSLGQIEEQHDSAQPMVIVARMNRRQVNELSVTLSKQEGQHAQLKEFAPTVGDVALKQAATGTVTTLNARTPSEQASAAPIDTDALTLDHETTKDLSKAIAPTAPAVSDLGSAGASKPVLRTEIAQNRFSGGRGDTPPATQSANGALAAPAPVAGAGESLHLSIDPLDEPVDVVIVVKKEAAAAHPTTAPKPQTAQPDGVR
jgi:hypothetical protein